MIKGKNKRRISSSQSHRVKSSNKRRNSASILTPSNSNLFTIIQSEATEKNEITQREIVLVNLPTLFSCTPTIPKEEEKGKADIIPKKDNLIMKPSKAEKVKVRKKTISLRAQQIIQDANQYLWPKKAITIANQNENSKEAEIINTNLHEIHKVMKKRAADISAIYEIIDKKRKTSSKEHNVENLMCGVLERENARVLKENAKLALLEPFAIEDKDLKMYFFILKTN